MAREELPRSFPGVDRGLSRKTIVRHDGDEWIINFQNHANDKKPSTIVKGPYRQLLLNGQHPFTRDFYLPDHCSADELCESLIGSAEDANEDAPPQLPCLLRLKSVSVGNWVHSYIDGIHSQFAEPLAREEREGITTAYRQRLRRSISDARVFYEDLLIRSPEGVGKTSALFEEIALEILDAALSRDRDKRQQFGCFAFRSTEQAQDKAAEYQRSGECRQAVVFESPLMTQSGHWGRSQLEVRAVGSAVRLGFGVRLVLLVSLA